MSAGNATTLDWTAEVTLVSQEGSKFKIKQYHLLSSSSFFRDMLETPGRLIQVNNSGKDDGIVLEIEASAEVLSLLLDLMQNKALDSKTPWPMYRDLLATCDKYDIGLVKEHIYHRLYDCVKEAPWAIFCLAARCDKLQLAKCALKAMPHDSEIGKFTITQLPVAAVASCTLNYYMGLVATIEAVPKITRSVAKHDAIGRSIGYETVPCANWTVIAEMFRPALS